MDSLLQRLLSNQERDARGQICENEDLKRKIENSKKAMSDQLTLSINNVRSLIAESKRDLQEQIDKVNKRMDSADKDNLDLIRTAIEENNKKSEKGEEENNKNGKVG